MASERDIRDDWAIASRRQGVVINHVVDVSETEAHSSASYVAKYILKGMLQDGWMADRGFFRRWTCSRDWPKPSPTQMQGTVQDAWSKVSWIPFDQAEYEVSLGRQTASLSPLAQLVGDPLVEVLTKRRRGNAVMAKIAHIGGSHASVS